MNLFSDLFSYLPSLASGLVITLVLMTVSVMFGLLLAVLMTVVSVSENLMLKKIIASFVFFIRGTPLLVQFFLIYYGAGQFDFIRHSFLWILLKEPMTCAVIALSINSACYTTILFSGAIHSVPQNEKAACDAIGMNKWLAFRRIIFPRAFRLALPAYSNEVIMVLKGTSLASTITLLDLMGVTQELVVTTYAAVELYLLAGAIYLLLNAVIHIIFRQLFKWSQIPQQSS